MLFQGNSGGPLICEGEILGIQTYIENSCKQPHLYTLLSAWNQFINCGTHEQCGNDEINCNICSVTYKDTVTSSVTQPTSSSESSSEVQYTGNSPTSLPRIEPEPIETTEHPTLVTLGPTETTETVTEESEGTSTMTVVSEIERTVTPSITVTSSVITTTESPMIVYMATTNATTFPNITIETVVTRTTAEMTTTTASTTEFRKHWPSEKSPSSNIKRLNEPGEIKRQPKAEAHQQNEVKNTRVRMQPKQAANAAVQRNLNLVRIFFAFLIFACNV